MTDRKKSGEPGWGWRKSIIFPVVAFCLWRMVALEVAADTRVNDTLAFGYMMLVSLLVLGYAGLATAQDIAAIWATRSALPYSPQSSPAEPTPGTTATAPPPETQQEER